MAKNMQLYTLFNILKSAGSKGVTKAQVSKQLNVAENSVPVYMFSMKKYFKAEFTTIKNGRAIVAYVLDNADKITVPQFRKGSTGSKKSVTKAIAKKNKSVSKPVKAAKTKSVNIPSDGSVAIPDKDLHVAEISDREFDDIRSSLGL